MKARLKAKIAFWSVPTLFWCGFGLMQTLEYCYNESESVPAAVWVLVAVILLGVLFVKNTDKRLLRVQSRAFDRFVEKILS